MTDMISGTCSLIKPLYEALIKTTLNTNYLHVDETPVPVLDKDKKGTTHRGYYWVYHNSLEGLVLFDYQPGRGREGPTKMLEGSKVFCRQMAIVFITFLRTKRGLPSSIAWRMPGVSFSNRRIAMPFGQAMP